MTNEPRSSEIRTWLARQNDEPCTSDWVGTEVAAALAIKVRTREISAADQPLLQAAFDRLRRESLRHLAFQTEFFGAAADAASRPRPALRAGDALHLAICLHYRVELCTLDAEQAEAGAQLGVKTVRL